MMDSYRCSIALATFTTALLSATASAADIYRWVDKNGRTQMSDRVPEEYKDKAVRIEGAAPPTEEQRRSALERAERDKARAAAIGARPQGAASQAAGTQAAAPGAGDACSRSWADYDRSQACFAPFRMANGAIRSDPNNKCVDVPQPSCQRPN